MRVPALRTISARIIVGFAVLILTFGAVSLSTVVNMQRLGREIEVIRNGYLPLALTAKDVLAKQKTLLAYLDDVPAENTPQRVAGKIRLYRAQRDKGLRDLEQITGDLAHVQHGGAAGIQRIVSAVREEVERQRKDYDTLVATPPLDSRLADPSLSEADRRQLAVASKALGDLRTHEQGIESRLKKFDEWQRQILISTAVRLESNSGKLRWYTIFLGATAILVGLLITIWATLTLRPLTRLREGARRVARGDYGSRIEARGPTEVADLAREFNAMGEAIEERERELVRSERLAAVGKMAAMITHEVRNPLSSIGLNTELLEEELAGLPAERAAEAQGLCRAITTEVDRLTAITEEYLHFARLPKPKLSTEQVNPIVEGLVDFERAKLSLRSVEVELDLEPDLPPVSVDDAQLRQALLNLVRNASEAVAELGGGTVTVGSRRARRADRPAVEITVSDDGPGIADELLPKVFDPFFSTKEGGTGLGLALTHQIVREHGGSIRVDSSPGHGATFVVSLPALTAGAPDHKLPA